MEHLDEGTIHAWIDGALDATRSRDIGAHVAQCATCSAAVAEARGLIAASSRILTALDDVPGGVLPKRAPALEPSSTPARRWRVSRWIPAAAAAALILAVGLVQVNREKGVAEMSAPLQDTGAPLRDQLANVVADSVAQPAAVPQTGFVAGGAGPATRAGAPPAAAPINESAQSTRERVESRLGAAGGGGAVASARGAAASSQQPATQKVEDVGVTSKSDVAAVKAAPEPTPVAAAPTEAAAQRRLDRVSLTDVPAVPQTLAGCYRIERKTGESLLGKAANVAGDVAGVAAARVVPRSRAPSAAAAPSQAEATFAAAVLPDGVRLDTTARRLGLPVLAQQSDSLLGWWTRSGRDTAQVRFLSGIVVTVTAKNRVTCPER